MLVQEIELSKKRKECENLEHEVKKRQKRCLDLVSNLLVVVVICFRMLFGSNLVFIEHYCNGHVLTITLKTWIPQLEHCLVVLETGEPAWGWAKQKWATKGGNRSPQEESAAARPGQWWASWDSSTKWVNSIVLAIKFFRCDDIFIHQKMCLKLNLSHCCCLSDSGWEWGAEGRALWSDRSTQFSSRGEPEIPCQTGEPRAGPKGIIELRYVHFHPQLCYSKKKCPFLSAYARGRWAKAAAGIGTWAGTGNP